MHIEKNNNLVYDIKENKDKPNQRQLKLNMNNAALNLVEKAIYLHIK